MAQDISRSVESSESSKVKNTGEEYRWVSSATFAASAAAGSADPMTQLLMQPAIVTTSQNPPPDAACLMGQTQLAQVKVLCQKFLEEGRLLRKLQHSDGSCITETINTFIGEVLKQARRLVMQTAKRRGIYQPAKG